ncbi:MAG TPA: RNA methyltransferase [Candidatus Methanoperedens sp.]|nr:RNA methyltransferase [Candidatus Methanoperedens sp.]
MKEIGSARNRALRRYRSLHAAAGRRETGLAAAEGFNLLREALLSEAELVQVFLSERARRRPDFEEIAARLEAGEAAGHWECFTLPGDLLERTAHTESPQGALAVFRPREFALAEAAAGDGPVLLLDRLGDPGNVGLILRTAEAAGAAGVVVTPGSADPLNPKCVRASAGSVFRMPVAHAALEAATAALQAAGRRFYATSPHGGVEYTAAALGGRVALFLGQEGGGLEPALLERFEAIRIPTGRVESLNVAMAAGILLYECRRQRTR